MKKIIKYIPVALLVALLCTACGVDDVYTYKGAKDNVYFDYEKPEDRAKLGSLAYSFFDNAEEEEYLFRIPVRISGDRVDRERTFNVVAQEEPDPEAEDYEPLPLNTIYAVEGVNYELNPEGVIPAGEGMGYVELTLLNTDPEMETSFFILKLDLAASDDFDVKFSGGREPLNTATVTFSQMLTMPDWWNPNVAGNYASELGKWSSTANGLFRIATGLTELKLSSEGGSPATALAWINVFKGMVRDPFSWLEGDPESGYVIADSGTDEEGYDKFTFTTVEPGGRIYEFRLNTDLPATQWLGDDGLWSVFY